MSFPRSFLCVALLLSLLPDLLAITTARDVRAAFDDLRALDGDATALYDESAGFSEKIIHLRHRLRDFALGSLIDAAARAQSLEEVPVLARQRIEDAGIPMSGDARWMTGGRPVRAGIELLRIAGTPVWVGARVAIQLPCGSDQAVYFVRLRAAETADQHYEAEFRLASEARLDSLVEAPVAFSVSAANGTDGDQLRVATIAAGGGCTSNWRSVWLQVLETGDHPYRPKKLFERERMGFLGGASQPEVAVIAGGFQFDYQAQYLLDPVRHSRMVRTRLLFEGDSIQVAPPDSPDPLEFLDEWVSSPWAESSRWISERGADDLRNWHRVLSSSEQIPFGTELAGTGRCAESPLVWIRIDRRRQPGAVRPLFGILRKDDSGFRVDHFSEQLPSGCHALPSGEAN